MGDGREGAREQGVPSCTHLCAHGPGGKHVPAVVELLWLHLGVAGPVVRRDAVQLGGALEDFHVVHQGFVARRDHWLVLQSGVQEGRGHVRTICQAPVPERAVCAARRG